MLAAGAFVAQSLGDINTTPASSNPSSFVAVGNEAYFAATDQLHGTELWKTDGTAAGTALVKDIVPGTASSNPTNLTDANGTLYFTITSPADVVSLWKSGGTDANTSLVTVLPQGTTSVDNMTAVGDNVYFVDHFANGASELWVSNQSSPLKDFVPKQAVTSLVDFNGKLYFAYNDTTGAAAANLGVSDGTSGGTKLLGNFTSVSDLAIVTSGGGTGTQTLYFSANGDLYDTTDGTTLNDVVHAPPGEPVDLTAVGGVLYYVSGNDLWSIVPPATTPSQITTGGKGVANLFDAGGTLYFTETGGALWAIPSAGAAPQNQGAVDDHNLGSAGNTLYFVGTNNTLWTATGGANSAVEIFTGGSSNIVLYGVSTDGVALNNQFLFGATTSTGGGNQQLWISNGLNAGTNLLLGINTGTEGSTPSVSPSAINVGGTVYFLASIGVGTGVDLDQVNGNGFITLVTRGVAAAPHTGNSQVMWDMNGHLVFQAPAGDLVILGSNGSTTALGVSNATYVTQVGNNWYFIDGASGKLWVTDGTSAGTKAITTTHAVANDGLATLGDGKTVYLLEGTGVPGATELYSFDGTTEAALATVGASTSLQAVGNRLIATGANADIYVSDGTAANTLKADYGTATPPITVNSSSFEAVNNGITFVGLSAGAKPSIWLIDTTDATKPTVSLVNGLTSATSVSYSADISNHALYVVAVTSGNGYSYQLWTSDGTAAGTKSIQTFTGASQPEFTTFNGKLFFVADDGTSGNQLWVTDGASASAVTNINANEATGGFNPTNLTVVNNELWMDATDGTHGDQPWISDGTSANTMLALQSGSTQIYGASGFTDAGNGAVFARATDGSIGSEPYLLVTAAPTAQQDVYVINTTGTSTVSAAQGVLANDTPSTGLTVTTTTATGVNGGAFVFKADGSFTYTPPASFAGFDSATYSVKDGQGRTASGTVYVLSQHAGIVWKFYEAVLDRGADPQGLAYWTNRFDTGTPIGDMAYGFFESDELLNKIIGNYYQQYLLRASDPAGLNYWKGVWHATGGPELIQAGFAASPEFYTSAGGTPEKWVDALYNRVLNRGADPQGQQYWLNYYNQQVSAGVDPGTVRLNIALGFFQSREAYINDVAGWFQEYLFRAPTPAESNQYVSEMLAGASDRQIEQQITNLPEYAQNPPAPPAGVGVPLPNYYAASSTSANVAATDAVFASLG